jgi:phosphopantothenoylcysteine synthetase/decarboxylase
MAVLDYVPSSTSLEKIPSDRGEWTLALKPTPEIIRRFKPLFPSAKLIGFKLASATDPEALRQAARELADSAQCDLVVANPPPFDNPSAHLAWLWEPESSSWTGPAEGKCEIADVVATWVCNQLSTGDSSRA